MQYLIRKKVFDYDNRIFTPTKCLAGVHSIFSNKEDAEKAKLELEREAFKSGIGFSNIYENLKNYGKVAQFFKEKFNIDIWENDEQTEIIAPIWLPDSISNEQLIEVMNFIDESFFEIVEKEEKAIFFRPEINLTFLSNIFPNDLANDLSRIGFHFNEHEFGYIMFNSEEDAFELGLYHLVYNLKNHRLPDSKLDEFVETVKGYKLDWEEKKIQISEEEKKSLVKSIKKHNLLTISEHELWDTMYASLEEHEEEIKYYHDMGHISYQWLALNYGVPDFLIEMKLNGELDEEEE